MARHCVTDVVAEGSVHVDSVIRAFDIPFSLTPTFFAFGTRFTKVASTATR